MKALKIIVIIALTFFEGYAQGSHVFSGGELANYDVLDIPTFTGATWSTDRTSTPGYFSVVNTAAYTGCSDAANINGYIKKYGNTSFIFPVGNGNDLRTLEISAPTNITDAYATAWILGDPTITTDPTTPGTGIHPVNSVKAPIVGVSAIGQWDWQVGDAGNLGTGTTGTGIGIKITVSIPDLSTFAMTGSLRLVGWDGTAWIDLSGAATATGNTENSTISGTMVAGISAIAIGSNTWMTPFKMDYLNVQPDANCNAVLTWGTSNEINTANYIIEQSIDNSIFSAVKLVPAKGSTDKNTYTQVIAQSEATTYYRLKIINKDGTYTYSKIIICKTNCAPKDFMNLYPNPVVGMGTVYLNFSTQYKGKAILMLTNMLGQRLMFMQVDVVAGKNVLPIEVGRFPAATYIVTLLKGAGVQIGSVQKFIKQ
ncbi:MAG: T9SS type A sorting domain-containing protein [Ferruginibacter sp.]